MKSALTILIADDNPSDRLLLGAMLKQFGHHVVVAKDGQEAVDLFDPAVIQLVCLDVRMPHKNGWEAAVEIQNLSLDSFIPIVFLSGVTDPVALSNCLEVGGADFIAKPYNPALVTAKLNAIARLLVMQKTLEDQRDAMAWYNEQLVHEQEMAKEIYENITHSNCLNDPALTTYHHASHTFNGDVILAAYKPNGGMHLLLGDFTGHGLSAAIGALPLADIFFDWTKKGFLMRQIIPEMNARLKSILPANMFCSAAFIDIKANEKNVEVWNGGLPDLLFFSQSKKEPRRLTSKNFPLGAVSPTIFECVVEPISYVPGDTLISFSDGVYEAADRNEVMFCESVLKPLYRGDVKPSDSIDWLIDRLKAEGVLDNPHDDISCLGISLDTCIGANSLTDQEFAGLVDFPADFSFEYKLSAESLRTTDPLPYVLQIITTVPGLSSYSSQVFMILSELYSNALEHGVLELDSSKKNTLDGFSVYYKEREQALASLKNGFVKISAKVVSDKQLGQLILEVEDSGRGFDYESLDFTLGSTEVPYNRGLALLHQICQEIGFSNGGRTVTAHFHWRPEKNN